MINTFFVEKIESIRAEFPLLEPTLQPHSFTDIDSIMPNCDVIFDHLEKLTHYHVSSVIIPLLKKPGLDSEILKNYRPVANLHFLSKLIEKAIAIQIHDHLSKTGIIDSFQSAYKAGHSCETALLTVFNDIFYD